MVRSDPSAARRVTAVLGRPRPGLPPMPEPVTEPLSVAAVLAGPTGTLATGIGTASDTGQGRAGVGRRAAGSLLTRFWPPGWRQARMDPGRPGATALLLVTVVAAVLVGWGVWAQRPQTEPVAASHQVPVPAGQPLPGAATAADPDAAPPTLGEPGAAEQAAVSDAAGARLVVSVSGKVHRPGLVEVPSGARVADAVAAAGGPLPGTDLSALNLARRIGDGEQVAVGVPPAPDAPVAQASGAGPPGAASGAPAGRIDLNSASAGQLDGLPGVGPVTAQRIVDWRTRNGRFSRLEQLREIEGIGERRFAQLRELVTV